MDYGMPTLLELPDIEACAALCLELGLQFIEINMNMPQYQPDRLDRRALKAAARQGLYFTFHLDENLNPADFNSGVARAYTKTVLATIDAAKELDAPILNMHMAEGVHFKLPGETVYLFEQYNEHYMAALLTFRNRCGEALKGGGINICIENCNGYLPFMERGIALLLESDAFQLTFDIGHSHCSNDADEAFLLANRGRLHHMHIHDAEGERCHLPLGAGSIDLPGRLALAREQNCRCVVETKSLAGLRQSVAYLRGL